MVEIRSRKKISDKPEDVFRHILFIPGTGELGKEVVLADLRHDDRQVVLVDIGVIGIDDILDPFGEAAHDVEVLGVGKTPDADGSSQQADVGVQPAAGDAVNLQGPDEEPQTLEDADRMSPG